MHGLALALRRLGTRWGFNLRPVHCPTCDAPLAFVRRPTSFRQALWGGYTCSVCATESDKWGRPIRAAE